MRKAKEKVWATSENKLVKDGDPDAAILIAAKDQMVPDNYGDVFSNFNDFFEEVKIAQDIPPSSPPQIPVFVPGSTNTKPVKTTPKASPVAQGTPAVSPALAKPEKPSKVTKVTKAPAKTKVVKTPTKKK